MDRRTFVKSVLGGLIVGLNLKKPKYNYSMDISNQKDYTHVFYGGNAGGGKSEFLILSGPSINSKIDNISIPKGY